MSFECNNIKLAIRNDKSEFVYAMCKQCLITANHDDCVLNYVNDMNAYADNHNDNVSNVANQKKHKPKSRNLRSQDPKEFLPHLSLENLELALGYPNLFMVRRLRLLQADDRESEASHQLCVEGYGNFRQFCDSDLEVAFRQNTCFVRNLEGFDLLKGNHTINLYTINLYEMASTSPICLMAHATSTKSWL
ncbi:hypothetical protein Tco_1321225 [Tanacetum coccineum]